MLRAFSLSALLAVGLSLILQFSLQLSDSFLWRYREPWMVTPVRLLQNPGIVAISRAFPCQREGFDTGCEEYKTLPLFLAVNALVYFPFVFLALFTLRVIGLTPRYTAGLSRICLVLGILVGAVGGLLSLAVCLSVDITQGLPAHDWPELILSIPLLFVGVLLVLFSRRKMEKTAATCSPLSS